MWDDRDDDDNDDDDDDDEKNDEDDVSVRPLYLLCRSRIRSPAESNTTHVGLLCTSHCFGRWQSRLTNREARISVSSRIPFVPVCRNGGSGLYRDYLRFRSRDVYRETGHVSLIFESVSLSLARSLLLSILLRCNLFARCTEDRFKRGFNFAESSFSAGESFQKIFLPRCFFFFLSIYLVYIAFCLRFFFFFFFFYFNERFCSVRKGTRATYKSRLSHEKEIPWKQLGHSSWSVFPKRGRTLFLSLPGIDDALGKLIWRVQLISEARGHLTVTAVIGD